MPMKRFPALRPKPADALVVLVVILLACAMVASVWGGGDRALTAAISVDGQVTETVDLSRLSDPVVRELNADGYTLHVRLSSGGAEVVDSDCPNQDCVHIGHITQAGQSIVCLPARISVTLSGGTETGVDAVLG